jgi:hypothetical protein
MDDFVWGVRPQLFSGYHGDPLEAPIELAREVVFGSVEYARALGFDPHPDSPPPRGISGRGQARAPSLSVRMASLYTSAATQTG